VRKSQLVDSWSLHAKTQRTTRILFSTFEFGQKYSSVDQRFCRKNALWKASRKRAGTEMMVRLFLHTKSNKRRNTERIRGPLNWHLLFGRDKHARSCQEFRNESPKDLKVVDKFRFTLSGARWAELAWRKCKQDKLVAAQSSKNVRLWGMTVWCQFELAQWVNPAEVFYLLQKKTTCLDFEI
jgi:hypothetical protein